MAAADFAKLALLLRPIEGAALTDADQTVQPFTDRVGEYVQSTPLTADRNKILGVNGAFPGMIVRIIRRDTAAHSLVIKSGGANVGTLFTFLPSPTEVQGATFVYNGVDWTFVPGGFEYLTVN